MHRATNTILFLFIGLISSNLYHPSQCSTVVDCDHQPCDPCYEETKQELADEIDDVNNYMQMVADQLTNDDVVVVRAIRTRFTTPDMENTLKSDILALEAGDFACDQPKDTTDLETAPSTNTDIESLLNDENISLGDTELSEMEQTYFVVENSPVKAKDLIPRNVEAEINMP